MAQNIPRPVFALPRRQALLGAGALLGLLPGAGVARAADAKVFLDYTQNELDRAYDQRFWAPDAGPTIAAYATDSAAMREKYPPRTERYGPTPIETLDVFAPPQAKAAPILIFLHGGAWLRDSKNEFSAAAPTFMENGCIYVVPDFATIPAVRLPDMADQCRRAVLWVAQNAARLGGDPRRIFIAGHSSGGHLAGVMLTTDWHALGAPASPLAGGLCMSGMYDLFPVMLSSRRNYVHISPEELAALSPLRHMDRVPGRVIIATGDRESPEFIRQSDVFARVLRGMGLLEARFRLFDTNHFQVPNTLLHADHPVAQAVLTLLHG